MLDQCNAMINYSYAKGVKVPVTAVTAVDTASRDRRTATTADDALISIADLASHRSSDTRRCYSPRCPKNGDGSGVRAVWQISMARTHQAHPPPLGACTIRRFCVSRSSDRRGCHREPSRVGCHAHCRFSIAHRRSLLCVVQCKSTARPGSTGFRTNGTNLRADNSRDAFRHLALIVITNTSTTSDGVDSGMEVFSGNSLVLTAPLIALLGGLSAQAVYRILERLVTTLEALVKGSGDEIIATEKRAWESRAATAITGSRTELAARLVGLEAEIGRAGDAASAERVRKLLEDLLPSANE